MILTTAEESRKLDRAAMEEYGLPEAVLMENAGASLVRLLEGKISWEGRDTVILCGTGNNGGDGFVAARYAAMEGADVTVLLMGNAAHMGESSRMYRKAAEKMGIPVVEISRAAEALPFVSSADILIDALIGTGLSSAVSGEKAALISMVNDAAAFVISADVPSGMVSDTGFAEGAVVEADVTVALGSRKRGHVLYPGSLYCGEVLDAPIGIPESAGEAFPVRLMELGDVRRRIPLRRRTAHKGNNGFVGIFAGSAGMAGAGLLAAQGALYGGAGKTALYSVNDIAWELAGKVPEVMVHGLADGACFTEDMVSLAAKAAEAFDVIAMGCGFGRREETLHFTESLLFQEKIPVVLDADALFAVAELHIPIEEAEAPLVLTPHVGEFARLTGLSPKEIEERRIDAAREYAEAHRVVLVLKGAPTVTALPDGRAWVNPTGNPGMASGGMGDTLTGVIAALLGQGLSAEDAAACGVYLHGLAGDILAETVPVGYTASELARAVPAARRRVMDGSSWKQA